MKIGFVLECSLGGPDAEIYPWLAKKFCPTLQIEKKNILTLTNKLNVMNQGATTAQTLLATGCDYVLIIWDRMPDRHGTGNCEHDETTVRQSLDALGVDKSKIVFCCIKDMLESWMLGDGNAITEYFQSLTKHPIPSFPDYKSSIKQSKPEEKLSRYNGRYNKFTDNFKIVKRIKDFTKIANRNDSFKHFKESIEDICPN